MSFPYISPRILDRAGIGREEIEKNPARIWTREFMRFIWISEREAE